MYMRTSDHGESYGDVCRIVFVNVLVCLSFVPSTVLVE
jgi:hypothetical protein